VSGRLRILTVAALAFVALVPLAGAAHAIVPLPGLPLVGGLLGP
jgi:hypothetical protein